MSGRAESRVETIEVDETTTLIGKDGMQETQERDAQGKVILRKNLVAANMGATAAADGGLLALIFGLHAVPWLLALLKPILFPIAPVIAGAKMVWSWVNVALDKAKKTEGILDAVMATLMFIAITVAVIIAFTALAALTPVLFTFAMGANTLYEAGKSIYHFVKAGLSTTKEERNQHLHAGGMGLLSTVIGATMTVAVGGLLLGGIKAFLWVGVAAAGTVVTVGTGLMIKGMYDLVKNWGGKKKAPINPGLVIEDNARQHDHDRNHSPEQENDNTVTVEPIFSSTTMDNKSIEQIEQVEEKITEKTQQASEELFKEEVLPFVNNDIAYGTLSKNSATHFGGLQQAREMKKRVNLNKNPTEDFVPTHSINL